MSVHSIKETIDIDPFNSTLSLFLLVLLVCAPFLIWKFLLSKQKNLEEEDFKPRFESLYLNIRTAD